MSIYLLHINICVHNHGVKDVSKRINIPLKCINIARVNVRVNARVNVNVSRRYCPLTLIRKIIFNKFKIIIFKA